MAETKDKSKSDEINVIILPKTSSFRFITKQFYKMFTVILKLNDKINKPNIYKAYFHQTV